MAVCSVANVPEDNIWSLVLVSCTKAASTCDWLVNTPSILTAAGILELADGSCSADIVFALPSSNGAVTWEETACPVVPTVVAVDTSVVVGDTILFVSVNNSFCCTFCCVKSNWPEPKSDTFVRPTDWSPTISNIGLLRSSTFNDLGVPVSSSVTSIASSAILNHLILHA